MSVMSSTYCGLAFPESSLEHWRASPLATGQWRAPYVAPRTSCSSLAKLAEALFFFFALFFQTTSMGSLPDGYVRYSGNQVHSELLRIGFLNSVSGLTLHMCAGQTVCVKSLSAVADNDNNLPLWRLETYPHIHRKNGCHCIAESMHVINFYNLRLGSSFCFVLFFSPAFFMNITSCSQKQSSLASFRYRNSRVGFCFFKF